MSQGSNAERITSYERDGLVFDVADGGPLEGDPVVLLHGFPERATSWAGVSARLHAEGLRTYAPDQRGYSPGARPRTRAGYRLPEIVDDALALIDRVGAPVHLVGHDWGAVVAWLVAGHHPELLRTLTAVSVPHSRAFAKALRTPQQARRSWYVAAFQAPLLPELAAKAPGGWMDKAMTAAGMTEGDVARFRREIVEDGALPGALGWYRAIPLSGPSMTGPRVSVPTTYVWSDRDTALDRIGAELTERYVDGPYEFVELSGVTHWIPSQAPDLLADAVLARTASVA